MPSFDQAEAPVAHAPAEAFGGSHEAASARWAATGAATRVRLNAPLPIERLRGQKDFADVAVLTKSRAATREVPSLGANALDAVASPDTEGAQTCTTPCGRWGGALTAAAARGTLAR
jgi:hypothetical protein